MKFLSFLNDLSHHQREISHEQVKIGLRSLIVLLRAIKRIRPELELHSSVPISGISLGGAHTLASVGADADTRDEWRFIRALDNKAFDLSREIADLSIEYEYQGQLSAGLGLAHLFDSLAVSFTFPEWDLTSIDILRRELQEDEELNETTVSVRHASTLQNLEILRQWCATIPIEHAKDGEELWANREGNFPSLRFLDRTQAQILSLRAGSPELHAICIRLWQLESAAQQWNPRTNPLPTFLSHVTPEHIRRRALCYFNDANGERCLYDLHARYTPGAGRIHFLCDTAQQLIEIAHIGQKL
ncbi:hypothetical protein ACTAB2_13115 [Pseudomonas syringae]|uniref:hypothetical protein n=1 Tax=Pseudomonas syringae TaxID=317 RepID=UPI003F7966A8